MKKPPEGNGKTGRGEARGRVETDDAQRREVRKRAGVVVAVSVVAALAWWGCLKGMRAYEKAQIPRITAELRAGDTHREGERMTVQVGKQEVALRWCPPGAFLMGSPAGWFSGEEGRGDEETQHRVTLSQGFWMAETEVTQGFWKEVMGGNRGNPAKFKNGDNYPVERVSWEACQAFVEALNKSYPQEGMRWALPTEAQWEYACRAGSTGAFAGTGNLDNMGWYSSNSGEETHPVGTKHPNAWGLHDMHGNVWEWCADWHGAYPNGAVTDPTGPSTGSDHVLRGGSWYGDARLCRSASRNWYPAGYHNDHVGFRPVCSAGPVQ